MLRSTPIAVVCVFQLRERDLCYVLLLFVANQKKIRNTDLYHQLIATHRNKT